jgi:myo-inositol-1(or 4)-monophosphatase
LADANAGSADPHSPLRETLARDTALLTSTVREAGALARSMFRTELKNWTKGASSPVSEADIAVNDLLENRLRSATPDYGWLSEESVDDEARLGKKLTWIVDPIDGTRSYLAGREDWCVSAALAVAGRPVLAVIFAPVTDELFVAVAGCGGTRNGLPMAATDAGRLDGATVAGPKKFVNWLEGLDPAMVAIPRIGSLALRLTRVAQGAIDIAFAGGNSHDWDLAAADLLVHEAGGAMTTLAGQPPTYNRPEPIHGALIAAGKARHAALLGLMGARPSPFV